jgi:hypothetical protein
MEYYRMKTLVHVMAVFAAVWTNLAMADWTDARCDIYPKGEDHTDVMIPCTFAQRQGNVTITRSDGVVHDLVAVGDDPGNYRDQDGKAAYRQSGLGSDGLIFRLENESVFVYWDTSALNPVDDSDNWTAPYTTDEYDATTRLRCGLTNSDEMDTCPAGILRMEDGQASIVITSPAGKQFTINFMKDYVNSGAGEVEAQMEGDTWMVIVNGEERYEVPLAAIEGG